jgi:hypothetical protein
MSWIIITRTTRGYLDSRKQFDDKKSRTGRFRTIGVFRFLIQVINSRFHCQKYNRNGTVGSKNDTSLWPFSHLLRRRTSDIQRPYDVYFRIGHTMWSHVGEIGGAGRAENASGEADTRFTIKVEERSSTTDGLAVVTTYSILQERWVR